MPTHGSSMAAGRFSVAVSQCCFKERSNECKSRPRVWPEANKCVNECVKQHSYINMALPQMSNEHVSAQFLRYSKGILVGYKPSKQYELPTHCSR